MRRLNIACLKVGDCIAQSLMNAGDNAARLSKCISKQKFNLVEQEISISILTIMGDRRLDLILLNCIRAKVSSQYSQ